MTLTIVRRIAWALPFGLGGLLCVLRGHPCRSIAA